MSKWLELHDLTKIYSEYSKVENINFSIEKGEIVEIVSISGNKLKVKLAEEKESSPKEEKKTAKSSTEDKKTTKKEEK